MGDQVPVALQNEEPGVIARQAWLRGNERRVERKVEF
jgi:hypothetical protein